MSIAIPATIRNIVWNTYIGVGIKHGICLCCNSEPITYANFECGHIIARAHGGEISISNLRPICGLCNKSVGTKNMDMFIDIYKIKRHPNWDGIKIDMSESSDVDDCDSNVDVLDDTENEENDTIIDEKENNVDEDDNDEKIDDTTGKNYQCKTCNLKFFFKSQLNRHKNRKIPCGISRIYSCEFCDYIFATAGGLKKHSKNRCKKQPNILIQQYTADCEFAEKEIEIRTNELIFKRKEIERLKVWIFNRQ